MGAGLYDPAFATLGRLYGHAGRSAITTLTLFGGFASTVCWPLSAFLEAHLGWRGACLIYAGFHLCVALPDLLCSFCPRESPHVALFTVAERLGELHARTSPTVSRQRSLPLAGTQHHAEFNHFDDALGPSAHHLTG